MRNNHSMLRKIFVGFAGGLIILLGLILIPTPAPEGWLIVFAGMTLLGTEFSFAKRWLKSVKALRLRFTHWIQRQPRLVQIGLGVLSGLIVMSIVALVVVGIVLS